MPIELKQEAPLLPNPDRKVGPEKKREILGRTNLRDRRDASEYLAIAKTDRGLKEMIWRKRHPLLVSAANDKIHVIFPPQPYVTRRNNLMRVTNIAREWEEPRYIFHSNQLRGPKTECTYIEVSLDEALQLSERMIAMFNEMNMEDQAAIFEQNMAQLIHPSYQLLT